ncbi:retinol dehydrogenase 11-like [Diorhabda sublineata]|uniref:retinol dehydrogenase 11-like n=1 Tax=Diorhabda sublineata TaxID=1163346 RepID=UPI0024E100FE|nr:retinol dehydrogenase 11-like [Diorhabda sublineata]
MIVYNYTIYIKYIAFAVITISLPFVALIVLKLFQKFSAGKVKSLVCLNGKTAIVTGATSAVGFQTALHLASRGCRVILADKKEPAKAKAKIIEVTNNTNIETKLLDFTSLQSVRKFAEEIKREEDRLDILINNAEVGSRGNKHTDDGLHSTMQVNYFGPFLLTHLLADLLKKSAPSRIIFVSSALAFCSNLSLENLNLPPGQALSLFRQILLYANSKAAVVIAANGFADKLKDHGVTSNSLHPGLINTKGFRRSVRIDGIRTIYRLLRFAFLFVYGKTPEQGAQTAIHLALSNQLKETSGKHFWDCTVFPQPPVTWNKKFCDDIWKSSEQLVDLKDEEKL